MSETVEGQNGGIGVRTEEQALIDTRAVRLRSLGYSYQKIADEEGCSKSVAYARVQRALAAIPAEAVDEYRRIEGERLSLLMEVAMARVLDGGKGVLFAIDRVLTIQERAARLFGLDAPMKHEVITLDYIQSEIIRLEAEVARDDSRAAAREFTEAPGT